MSPSGVPGDRPSGTVTFLFTDVEGSTRLWAADKEAMSASLLVHDAILRGAIEGNGGYVFTTAGDSFAAAFARASDAVRAATESQRALMNASWPGPALKVRMGLHLGEAEERGGDYFGPTVNTTARVEAAGHGGQVLITEPVRIAAGITDVTDLGTRTLRDVAEPLRLIQLGNETFATLRVVDPALSNLPVRPTRLIGRESAVDAVRQRLASNRLVTITAVGGSGKTRVALAVGEAELPHRSGGVWFVDLTSVMSGADVPGAVATSLGLTLTTGDPTAQITRYLADKPVLIILDNCEHLIDACAEFSEAFLATQGPAAILATSREALAIDGEQIVVLSPLTSESVNSPAVRLFVDRTIAVEPRFELTPANSETVAAICGRLDGMPLAIELAAARMTVMSPAELLAGLDSRFQLLSGGRRRQRSRTLEATLDWSYDLLDAEDQRVFRSLGVFVDGFDIDAVAAVATIHRAEALDAVEALVAKSLVDRADKETGVRFRLLETVKAYAEDRLVDAGEAADIRNRHFDHFHRIATVHGRIITAELLLGIRLRPDRSNITAGYEWASANDQPVRAAELILGARAVFDLDLAWFEVIPLVERSIEHCSKIDIDLTERLKAALVLLFIIVLDPRSAQATTELFSSPVAPVRAIGLATLAFAVAMSGFDSGQKIDAAQLQIDDLTIEDSGHVAFLPKAILLIARAVAAAQIGDYQSCLTHSEAILRLNREFKGVVELANGAILASLCHILLGHIEDGLRINSDLQQYNLHEGRGDDIRAIAHLALGDIESASTEVRHFAERAASGRFPGEAINGLTLLAGLSLGEHDPDRARELLAQITGARNPMGNIYGNHLARQLGVLEEHVQRKRSWFSVQFSETPAVAADPHQAALRAELTRRGWA